MLDLFKLRKQHGYQSIPDIRNVKLIETYRGFPLIDESKWKEEYLTYKDVCPTNAIKFNPLSIDLGKCTYCGECERAFPTGAIKFTNEYRLGSTRRNNLIVTTGSTFAEYDKTAIESERKIHKLFGRSLKLRQVSAAGCNGCEMELNACTNVNFDIGRFGIEFVASPRHADGIVITGPITKNMAKALEGCYEAVPHPKIIILFGTCAISGGIFQNSSELQRKFLEENKIDLFIPGCPPHPLTFINGLLDWLDKF